MASSCKNIHGTKHACQWPGCLSQYQCSECLWGCGPYGGLLAATWGKEVLAAELSAETLEGEGLKINE
jgi:hypothetical protein